MDRHSQTTHRLLHWVMAALVIFLISLGYYMTTYQQFSLYHLHKSLAVLVIPLLMIRVFLRIRDPWRSGAAALPRWVSAYHWLLLVGLLLMLVSGAAYSGFGGYGIGFFGIELVSASKDALQQYTAYSATLSTFGQQVHVAAGYALSALLGLHVVAALKHHFVDRDNTLRHMLWARG
ncbi:cytochrome b/b6 domain-containing protein [Microbulbifer salipaludis]|uniref:Cytochrome b/b6 domain-containing protein n=1 Tax=Microbulbifer salipaludis TaxID=187980 RepID=A0ABS3E202_9GAMM|nr:cytochrome b/b6 domain-containing protein [Microbulbifer salipaludis]MBN8429318.1 cytochrome b/b6 domain-containing protein [Microbulbifer salipaludis]